MKHSKLTCILFLFSGFIFSMKSQIPTNIIERADLLLKSNIGFMYVGKAKIMCNETWGHYNSSNWVLCPDTTLVYKLTKKGKVYLENLRKNYKPDYFHFSYSLDLNIGQYYIQFELDTLGRYLNESKISLPDTSNNYALFQLQIDSTLAKNIAKKNGFIDGIQPWTFSIISLENRFYWEIRNTTRIYEGYPTEGNGMLVDAITGEVDTDKMFHWVRSIVY